MRTVLKPVLYVLYWNRYSVYCTETSTVWYTLYWNKYNTYCTETSAVWYTLYWNQYNASCPETSTVWYILYWNQYNTYCTEPSITRFVLKRVLCVVSRNEQSSSGDLTWPTLTLTSRTAFISRKHTTQGEKKRNIEHGERRKVRGERWTANINSSLGDDGCVWLRWRNALLAAHK